MGAVYRALDSRLNRLVAIKFLFDDVADSAARRQFQWRRRWLPRSTIRTFSLFTTSVILTAVNTWSPNSLTEARLKIGCARRSPPGGKLSNCWWEWPTLWQRRTELVFSTAILSRTTSWLGGAATPSWQISDWQNCRSIPARKPSTSHSMAILRLPESYLERSPTCPRSRPRVGPPMREAI